MKYVLPIVILFMGTLLTADRIEPALQQASRATTEPLTLSADEVAKLIDDCGVRTTQMAGRLYSSTFNQIDTEYVIDKHGRIKREESKVFEVYPIRVGNRQKWIYVQVGEDGVSFGPERIANERNRAVKETARFEQQSNAPAATQTNAPNKRRFMSAAIKVEKRGRLSRTIWFISPTDFLVSHEFYAPRRVRFAGRETFLLNFRPRPSYVYDKTNVPYPEGVQEYGRTMSQLGGRIWIDAIDKVIARLEAKPARELNESVEAFDLTPDENAPVWFELTRLPSGLWAPSESRYNSYGREDLFWKTPISRARKYTNYRLFKTTAEVERIESKPNSP